MNMLQAKKEELKKQGKKGFTLMELLIVVAIIAVLVAIAIPMFTNQLETSREAVDIANIRDAYAVCSAAAMTGTTDKDSLDATENISYDIDSTTKTVTATITLTQKKAGWQGQEPTNIGGVTPGGKGPKDNGGTATVSVTSTGETTITIGDKE